MPTVYGSGTLGTDSSSRDYYLRNAITYNVSEDGGQMTISGTAYVQHTGAADSGSNFNMQWGSGVRAEVGLETTYDSWDGFFRTPPNQSSVFSSVAYHSTWTNVVSVNFSFTVIKTSSQQTRYLISNYNNSSRYGSYIGSSGSSDAYARITIPIISSYSVTYDANGGVGAPSSQTRVHGDTVVVSSVTPTREGYVFDCWNTEADGSGTEYHPGQEYWMGNSNVVLYAIWRVTFTISNCSGVFSKLSGVQDCLGTCAKVTFSFSTSSPLQDAVPYSFRIGLTKIVFEDGTEVLPSSGSSSSGNEATPVSYLDEATVLNENHDFSGTLTAVLNGQLPGSLTRRKYNPTATYYFDIIGSANTGSVKESFVMYPDADYHKPNLSVVSLERVNVAGGIATPDIYGSYARIVVNYDVKTTLTTEQEANNLQYNFDEQGWVSYQGASLSSSGTATYLLGPYDETVMTPEQSYPITVKISDNFETTSVSTSLGADSSYYAPDITSMSIVRSTSSGEYDVCGAYVKATVEYDALSTGAAPVPTITVSFNSGEAEALVCDAVHGSAEAILGPYISTDLMPTSSYPLAFTISDRFHTNSASGTLPADSNYDRPQVFFQEAVRVTSNDIPDALGGYVRVVGQYVIEETTTQTAPSEAKISINNGQYQTASVDTVAKTFRILAGPYTYADIKPDDSYPLMLSLSDKYYEASASAILQVSDYTYVSLSNVEAYRAERNGDESDDGVDLHIEVEWNVYNSVTQTQPQNFIVTVNDGTTDIIQDEMIKVGDIDTSYPNGWYIHVKTKNEDVVAIDVTEGPTSFQYYGDIDSETRQEEIVVNQDLSYVVTVSISDLYSVATKSVVIPMAFLTMDVLAGGHGIGFGMPSRRATMDVDFPLYLDKAIHIGEELSLPVYIREKMPKTILPVLPAVVVFMDGSTPSIYLAKEGTEITDVSVTSSMHSVSWVGVGNVDRSGYFKWPSEPEANANSGLYVTDNTEHSWTCVPIPLASGEELYSVIDAYFVTESGEICQFKPEQGNTFSDYIVQLDPNASPVTKLDLETDVPYFHFKHYSGCGWHEDAVRGEVYGTFYVVYETTSSS